MFKAVTIKDIAQALSVSPSTVSRALRNSYEISDEKKKMILEYAAKINYHSNPIAVSLRNKRSNSIGVMVAEVANSFFSQTINGIESIAYEKGYNIIISQSHDSYDREVINLEHLASRSVDGLLISMSSQTTDYQHIERLHNQGLPIVFFDRIINSIDTYKVTTDNFKSAFDAIDLLVNKGMKNIAHIGNAPQLSITIERLRGYKEALKYNKITPEENLIKFCPSGGKDSGEVDSAIKELFSLSNKPDAIFISSDLLSNACLRALKNMPLHKQIPIIGFSNSDVVDLMMPEISYVRQRAFEMGQIAANMLLKIIESKYPLHEFETKMLDAELYRTGILLK
jgi:LacI family transcriptional regulator